jgi:hypothetical protein
MIKTIVENISQEQLRQKRNYRNRRYRNFNLLLVVSLVSPLLLIGGVNISIDPYGFYNSATFNKINRKKPERDNYSRLYKAMDLKRKKPSILLMGSSRTEEGLEADSNFFANKESVYNLGLQAVTPYEMLRYFEYALKQQPEIKQVIIGVDFFMFNQYLEPPADFDESRLKTNFPTRDILNTSLSFDAFASSYRTLDINFNNKAHSNIESDSKTTEKFKFWLKAFLSRPELYGRYKLASDRLNYLHKIIEICRQKKIKIEIFISPIHATESKAIELAGLWFVYEQWKRDLVRVYPVWDFANYNSVTIESVGDNMKYYIDSSHYNKKTGNLILGRLFRDSKQNIPQDFGVLISPQNIESHLEKTRKDSQIWSKNNINDVRLVTNIKDRVDRDLK